MKGNEELLNVYSVAANWSLYNSDDVKKNTWQLMWTTYWTAQLLNIQQIKWNEILLQSSN